MTALILTIAVAAMLTPLILARSLVAIPGGLAATLAWWVAASASVGLMPGVAGVAYTALGIGTPGRALADARRVSRRERDRLADAHRPGRTGDPHPASSRPVRHPIALAYSYGPDHESEPARCTTPRTWCPRPRLPPRSGSTRRP